MQLFARTALILGGATKSALTAKLALPQQTERLTISILRPTTAGPVVTWTDKATIRVTLIITIDGREHRYIGQATGGARSAPTGGDLAAYRLVIYPTWGFLGGTETTKRLGETAVTEYAATVLVEVLRGSLSTWYDVGVAEAPAPTMPFHSSVAFDAATSALEEGGDKILSLSHTASGADRAVFAASSGYGSGAGLPSTSCTYAGNAMTEMWDEQTSSASNFHNAGYQLAGAGVTTGAQTVTNTLGAGTASIHFLLVMSMTGVDGTTPVGTPVLTTFKTSPWSDTVSDAAADDLIVDSLCCFATGTPAVGGGQTNPANLQQVDAGGTVFARASYQAGSGDDIMSWTATGSIDGFLGAVAFKAAAGGAAPAFGFSHGQRSVQRGLGRGILRTTK